MNVKSRLVLADIDEDYIVPLQINLAKCYSLRMEIEIITREDYFNKFFSSPQDIDILIISERLYDDSLLRHNLANVFVLTEQQEKADQSSNYIYKYSSVNEILSIVFGKSLETLKQKEAFSSTKKSKNSKVVLFYSINGGTGKTTISMGLSACLSKQYKSVLFIDASYFQTFQFVLNENEKTYINNSKANVSDFSFLLNYVRKGDFDYLPPFNSSLLSLGVDFNIFKRLIDYFKKLNTYDVIVVDTDCVFNEEKADLLDYADLVFIVTKQFPYYAKSLDSFNSNICIKNPDKFIVVCNDFSDNNKNAYVELTSSKNVQINEYIRHIEKCESLSITEISNHKDIQKLSFLC